eukprot:12881619-Prorocentrum_lima.AAC.1
MAHLEEQQVDTSNCRFHTRLSQYWEHASWQMIMHTDDGRQEVLAEGIPGQDGAYQHSLVKMKQSINIGAQHVDRRRWLH